MLGIGPYSSLDSVLSHVAVSCCGHCSEYFFLSVQLFHLTCRISPGVRAAQYGRFKSSVEYSIQCSS